MLEGTSNTTYVTAAVSVKPVANRYLRLTEEDNQTNAVLVRSEVQIRLHARNLRISDAVKLSMVCTDEAGLWIVLCPVHVREKIHEPHHWHEVQVNLANDLLLLLRCP